MFVVGSVMQFIVLTRAMLGAINNFARVGVLEILRAVFIVQKKPVPVPESREMNSFAI